MKKTVEWKRERWRDAENLHHEGHEVTRGTRIGSGVRLFKFGQLLCGQ